MDETARQDDARWRPATYDAPVAKPNVDDVRSAMPASGPDSSIGRRIDEGGEHDGAGRRGPHASVADGEPYTFPDGWTNLDELAATSPVENVAEAPTDRHHSLEDTRGHEKAYRRGEQRRASLTHGPAEAEEKQKGVRVSELLTQVYTLSYLVFFSFLGTLARLGLTALTNYPGAPVAFSAVWANFGGSLVMGFLAEDRMLFRHERGTPTYDQQLARAKRDEEAGSASGVDLAAAKRAHVATKKTMPLYIGLATGFCGSFTSFSAFIRDDFLALSNDLVAPGFGSTAMGRNGGYSFMAMLAVIMTTVSLALTGLFLGAHLAIASERLTPSIPYPITRKLLDPLAVFLGGGCWLGAVLLSIFPPSDDWRDKATFSLVFAPLGCLLRFHLAVHLNGKVASFPLGTFAANVLGTAVLGMAWDIAHVPIGGVVGCQVLQGVEDGFCGCLTTVSTWVVELSSLRRRSSYIYGTASVVVSLALMIAIMGGLRWTEGFGASHCHQGGAADAGG
ncbi:Membrane protein [Tolypocladium capitatum]|uniref:Membrane protein n=1 Tax=Tolypocladium capitatum TaxID=45235 RepID=A0A2K3QJ04_9HYPO|nr:Membrane protein [Tolypocladium capitatum]